VRHEMSAQGVCEHCGKAWPWGRHEHCPKRSRRRIYKVATDSEYWKEVDSCLAAGSSPPTWVDWSDRSG
jgi:hypothetical protein